MDEQNTNTNGVLNKDEHRTLLGVLAYIGPLVIVPLIAGKNDSFVKFHAKQGLVLLVLAIILWILLPMLWTFGPFGMFWGIIKLLITILAIIGVVNVVGNKEKPLPVIGGFSKYFTF